MRWWFVLVGAGCAGAKDGPPPVDLDGDDDGFDAAYDCDDADPSVHPGAPDTPYDGIDADCAGDSDEDADHDGVDRGPDCDDSDPAVLPGADERCNGVDDDCDGSTDGPDAVDATPWYPDGDEDGHGEAGSAGTPSCGALAGLAPTADDCDDADPANYPGNAEACDAADNDCDALVDEGLPTYSSWPDADGDGFGDASAAPSTDCAGVPAGSVGNDGDCDDGYASAYPGAPDVECDDLDNDCDPTTFEAGGVTLDRAPVADLALALAGAGPGSTIELCEGEYLVDAPSIPVGLTLVGPGSAVTRLDGQGAGPVLAVDTTAEVVLSGLALTNGGGRDDGIGTFQGGGLYVRDGGNVVASDLVVEGNAAGEGGGMWLGDGAVLVFSGGAIRGNVALDSLAFTASFGGGLWAGDGVGLTFAEATIEGNVATGCGGMSLGADVSLDGSGTTSVRANSDDGLGGGGICAEAGGALHDLEVADNVASNSGGGILGSGLALSAVTLTGNTTDLAGGGLYASGFANVTLSDCVVSGNSAVIDGGGLYVSGALLTVDGGEVSGNEELFFASFGGGAGLGQSALLSSVGADWSGNLDDDVGIDELGFSYGGVATFVCDGATATCY